MSNDVSLNMY